MKKSVIFSVAIVIALLCSCRQEGGGEPVASDEKSTFPEWKEPKKIVYELKDAKQWLLDSTITDSEKELVFAVNRTDRPNFEKMDTVVVPVDLSGNLVYYFPFPLEVSYLEDVDKIIFFSYATQVFAAYENGKLVLTGPTNMGREKDPTPTGLFFTNWKAKKTISTFNDEWELRWNFNIANKKGIGWHQYDLPGYPASHSCLRLREEDAKYLYNWADQWVLANKTQVQVKGTPVIVFGNYDFHSPKPWLQLLTNPHALDISKKELKNVAEPFMSEILSEQENRNSYELSKKAD